MDNVIASFTGQGPDLTEWDQTLSTYLAARAAEVTYDQTVFVPAYDAANASGASIPEHVNAEYERLQDIRCDIEERIVRMSAPDLHAVIWKIEQARERWKDFEDWPALWWGAVMADLRRLAGPTERPVTPASLKTMEPWPC